jgi:type VI secretion system secreted protein Hcp
MILATIDESKQGRIFGAGPGKQWSVLSLSWGVSVPTDTATGLPSGQRIHRPVSLVMEDSENTAQLLQAIVTNEVLTDVVLSITDDSTGELAVRMALQNAILTDFSMSSGGDRPTESFTLNFQKITYTDGNKTASDDWQSSTTG